MNSAESLRKGKDCWMVRLPNNEVLEIRRKTTSKSFLMALNMTFSIHCHSLSLFDENEKTLLNTERESKVDLSIYDGELIQKKLKKGRIYNIYLYPPTSTECHPRCVDDVKNGRCTYSSTEKTYRFQKLYLCRTCYPKRNRRRTGICESCVHKCHQGHDIVFDGILEGYCNCGSTGEICKCIHSDEEEETTTTATTFTRVAANRGNFHDEGDHISGGEEIEEAECGYFGLNGFGDDDSSSDDEKEEEENQNNQQQKEEEEVVTGFEIVDLPSPPPEVNYGSDIVPPPPPLLTHATPENSPGKKKRQMEEIKELEMIKRDLEDENVEMDNKIEELRNKIKENEVEIEKIDRKITGIKRKRRQDMEEEHGEERKRPRKKRKVN